MGTLQRPKSSTFRIRRPRREHGRGFFNSPNVPYFQNRSVADTRGHRQAEDEHEDDCGGEARGPPCGHGRFRVVCMDGKVSRVIRQRPAVRDAFVLRSALLVGGLRARVYAGARAEETRMDGQDLATTGAIAGRSAFFRRDHLPQPSQIGEFCAVSPESARASTRRISRGTT